MVNVTFTLQQEGEAQWWGLQEQTTETRFDLDSDRVFLDNLRIISFNDRVAPSAFSFFTSYG